MKNLNRYASLGLLVLAMSLSNADGATLSTTDGFYGVWYSIGSASDPIPYKYSGGLGTYPQQTSPIAVHVENAAQNIDRTYFLYGGTNGTNNVLRNYISYYDHNTDMLARPRQIRNVGGNDIHKNTTMTFDDSGNIYVFGNSHGNTGTGNLYKSDQPYQIGGFTQIPLDTEFNNNSGNKVLAYSAPYFIPGQGIMMAYSQYDDGRAVHVARISTTQMANMTATTSGNWIDQRLFDTGDGHYSIARTNGTTFSVAADYHNNESLDQRTNLYYFQTNNFGTTWTNVAGQAIALPGNNGSAINNNALVHNYLSEQKLVYMKDINYDAAGNPILLYLTVSADNGTGHESGPHPGGRMLHTARWTGVQWDIQDAFQTDHNYDHGELYVEADGTWRVIGAYLDGPQEYGTGGQVGDWISADQGQTWTLENQLTHDSENNHTYVRRPVNADDEFYAYWADGNAFQISESSLYFSNKRGDVFRMPKDFDGNFAAPELVWSVPEPSSFAFACIAGSIVPLLARRRSRGKIRRLTKVDS